MRRILPALIAWLIAAPAAAVDLPTRSSCYYPSVRPLIINK